MVCVEARVGCRGRGCAEVVHPDFGGCLLLNTADSFGRNVSHVCGINGSAELVSVLLAHQVTASRHPPGQEWPAGLSAQGPGRSSS